MTGPASAPAAGRRVLRPGGGVRLRQAYARLLLVSALAVLVVVPIALTLAGTTTLHTGAAVVVASSVLLLAALVRGRSAVHGDQVAVRAAGASAMLSRFGGAIGWLGAVTVLTTGIVQRFQGVDDALLEGILLGGVSLVPAVANDATNRIAKRLIR